MKVKEFVEFCAVWLVLVTALAMVAQDKPVDSTGKVIGTANLAIKH